MDPGGTFEIVCCENTLLVPHLPANWRGLTGWSRGWQLAAAALPTLCLPSLWRGQDIQNLSGDSSTTSLYTPVFIHPASPDRRAPLTFTIHTRLLPGVGGDGERVPVQTTPLAARATHGNSAARVFVGGSGHQNEAGGSEAVVFFP